MEMAWGDVCDVCPYVPDPAQTDSDGNGRGDLCEDTDGDTVPDVTDNCVFTPNKPQPGMPQDDRDQDGLGDACDPCPDLNELASPWHSWGMCMDPRVLSLVFTTGLHDALLDFGLMSPVINPMPLDVYGLDEIEAVAYQDGYNVGSKVFGTQEGTVVSREQVEAAALEMIPSDAESDYEILNALGEMFH